MSVDPWKMLANFTTGVTAGLVIVMILRPMTVRVLGARATYGLWLIVPTMICALLVPAPFTHAPLVVTTFLFQRIGSNPIAASAHLVEGVTGQLQMSLLTLWGAGAIGAMAVTLVRQRRYWRSLGQMTRDGSGVLRAEGALSPALIGILHPRLILPVDFEERYTASERQLMLAHEEVHRRRGDPLMNALGAVIRCLQWFNPLAHWGHGIYRWDQELACDAIAAGADHSQRAIYAELLVKTQRLLDDMPVAPLGAAWQSVHPLAARLASLRRRAPSVAVSRLGASVLTLSALAVAYGGWTMRAEAATSTDGVPIAMHINWSMENVPKGASETDELEKRSLVTDTVVSSGKSLELFFTSAMGVHEYELNCTPKVLIPQDGSKAMGQIWIRCDVRRSDGTLIGSPRVITLDNEESVIEIANEQGKDRTLVYRVKINASTAKARVDQAQAAQKSDQAK